MHQKLDGYNTEICILSYFDNQLKIFLLQNSNQKYCLPGGFVSANENAKDRAINVIAKKLNAPISFLRHVAIFDEPNRDYRGWIISNVFYAIVKHEDIVDKEHLFFPIDDLPQISIDFDHDTIIDKVVANIKKDLLETSVAQHFLPNHFTIRNLQILLSQASNANEIKRTHFFTKIKSKQFIKPVLDAKLNHLTTFENGSKRPSKLYYFDETDYISSIYF